MENTENGETRKAKTVIVGSRGRMGKMLLERAKDADMECTGLDQPLERPEIERALADVELVFLCVPAKVIGEVLQKIVPCLPAKTILSDITSVKERPLRQMERAWTGTVVGTHPLFGPKNSPDTDVTIYGHTDNTGSRAVNERISKERADAVANYLVSQGISRSRMTTEGLAFDQPVADNSTASGRAQNRRVEVYITANADMIRKAQNGQLN